MPMEFRFTDPSRTFACSLERRRCAHVHPTTGARCSRLQYIGGGLCWQHLALVRRVKVAFSTIPGAGKGLFAFSRKHARRDVLFRPGDVIVPYDGEILTKQEHDARYGKGRLSTAPYSIQRFKTEFEDGACLRGAGALVNTRPRANAKISNAAKGHTIKIVAISHIKNGDEITVSYGPSYRMTEEGVSHATRATRGPYRQYATVALADARKSSSSGAQTARSRPRRPRAGR